MQRWSLWERGRQRIRRCGRTKPQDEDRLHLLSGLPAEVETEITAATRQSEQEELQDVVDVT
jgi:hypothetical protein